MRDLMNASGETVAAERSRVASEGWGAQLLDRQGPDGKWGHGTSTPQWAATHEYLLERRMFRKLSSGAVIDHNWTRFSFPTTWHYDVLRGLDYLRSAGVGPDERVAEAVGLVAKRAHQNGRWRLHEPHPDPIHLDMEGGRGKPSRWNTLRALRVLDWYSDPSSGSPATGERNGR